MKRHFPSMHAPQAPCDGSCSLRFRDGSTTLDTMSDEQLADALATTEAHLARRPSWRVGEQCVRLLVGEQRRREQNREEAA